MYDENKWNEMNQEENRNSAESAKGELNQESTKESGQETSKTNTYGQSRQAEDSQNVSQPGAQGTGSYGSQSSYGTQTESQPGSQGTGSYGSQSGYGAQAGSQSSAQGTGSYGSQSGYGTQVGGQSSAQGTGSYSSQSGYGTQAGSQSSAQGTGSYGSQSSYGTQAGSQSSVQGTGSYGSSSGYGGQNSYGAQGNGNYGGSNGYGSQNHNAYGNPYQYNHYQNGNRAYNTNPVHKGPQEGPKGSGHGSGKGNYGKTVAMVTAAALLFGVVSGGTMYGVNRAAWTLFPAAQAETQAPAETQISQQPTTATTQPSSGDNSGATVMSDVSAVVENAMPSVVAITNTMLLQSNSWFGQSQTYEVPSSGSGIIVGENDTELLVVTNNHVIENANSLTVTFVDGSSVEAAIKGTDTQTDLAVLAVPLDQISADTKSQITAATLGDSDSLKMGQGVIAIGNALGRGQSVTVGYVSALNREIVVDGVRKNVIQTDAAINPGNSGGALLNAAGEVVGINEAKYANASVEGVGYAIPVSDVKGIIDDLMTRTTKVAVPEEEQGYMGVRLRNVDAASAELYGMPQGAFVYQILEDGPAAQSDLREQDIITKVNGDEVTSGAEVTEMMTYYKAGDTITLTVQYQENGSYKEREVSLTLGKRPAEESTQQVQSGQ